MTNKYKIKCSNGAFYPEIKFCLKSAGIPFAQKDENRPVVCRASKDKDVQEAFSECLINENEYTIYKKMGDTWFQMDNHLSIVEEYRVLKNLSDREKRIYNRLQNGEYLSEKDISYLVDNCELREDREVGENRRWSRSVCSIVELGGKYYSITWEEGLTENQENDFTNQPIEVKLNEYEKTITVREWNPVNQEELER